MATEVIGTLVYDALKSKVSPGAKQYVEEITDAIAVLAYEVVVEQSGIIELPGLGLFGLEGTQDRIAEMEAEAAAAAQSARRASRSSKAKAEASKKTERPAAKGKATATKTSPSKSTAKKAPAKRAPAKKAVAKATASKPGVGSRRGGAPKDSE